MLRIALPLVLTLFVLVPSAIAASPAVPPPQTLHIVRAGETLWNIARRHGTAVETLVRLNGLSDPDRLQPDQRIRLPAAAAAPLQKRSVPGRRAIAPAAALRPRWQQWPSRGIITSRFGLRGRRHHHGIDIAAPVGTPIYAVQAGRVQFVGRMGGYGLLVILDHGGGLTTWYGHASRVLVAVGDEIRRGQVIAAVGTTGNVTGPNVHFEVRRNDVPLDPLKFLQTR
jgi:murein DD-endopeptidase MepM/ murein hydrolase activator NlpD